MNDGGQTNSLELFDELVDLPISQRRAQLEHHDLDPDTRREVESLLAAHDDAGEFFSEPPPERTELDRLTVGSWIGAYELLELIGEGGFARVFRARQAHPVKREVAVKLIKLGMDTRALIGRFDQERQALARMDHPNIAAIHDAGATDTGRPYFVMELVRGERITRYCDDAQLSTRQRVELFIGVCNAIQHAHQKGILHRDLKPSNILVTAFDGCPTPIVIDFGIAKAMQERLTDATIITQERQMLGTPQYMSPEHALSGGADVDTRSDVYSLGAVLYEILAGVPPLASADATSRPSSTLQQLQELTSDRVISPPSTRASGELRRALRGELDWIVGKCLEKDRARRYESAAALSADLQAFLDRRPIAAAPPGAVYRARKFVRRNAVAVIAAVVVLLTLIAGSIVSTTMAIRAIRADRLSVKRLGEVQDANENLTAVNKFLTEDMIGSADPAVTRGAPLTVHEALDKAAQAVTTQFRGRPLTEAAVRESVAYAFGALGKPDQALPHATEAVRHRRQLLGDDHPDTIRAIGVYGDIQKKRGLLREAEPLLKESWERYRRVKGDDCYETINALDGYANVLNSLGRFAEAEPLARTALEQSRRVLGSDHIKTLTTTSNFARVLYNLGRYAEVASLLKEAVDISVAKRGEDHPESMALLNNYAVTLKHLGRLDEAEPLCRRVMELRQRVLGADHPDTLLSCDTYAGLLYMQARYEQAISLMQQTLERRRRTLEDDHPDTITSMNNYSVVLMGAGRAAEAVPLLQQVLERRRRVQGEDHPDTLSALHNYARVLHLVGRTTEAIPLHREALDQRRRVLGEDHPSTLVSMMNCAEVLREAGRPNDAEPLSKQALERCRRVHGEDHASTLTALNNYGCVLAAVGDDGRAEPIFAELYAKILRAQIAPGQAAQYAAAYGLCLARLGQYEQAEAPLRDAHRRLRETKQSGSAKMREVITALAEVCERTNRPDEAAALRRELRQSSSVIASTLSWSNLVTCSLAR